MKYKTPIVISLLGTVGKVNQNIYSDGWLAIVLYDIILDRHARKVIKMYADGLIVAGVCGRISASPPLAMIQQIHQWLDGPPLLSGAIINGL